jgi:hypothetical protein
MLGCPVHLDSCLLYVSLLLNVGQVVLNKQWVIWRSFLVPGFPVSFFNVGSGSAAFRSSFSRSG